MVMDAESLTTTSLFTFIETIIRKIEMYAGLQYGKFDFWGDNVIAGICEYWWNYEF